MFNKIEEYKDIDESIRKRIEASIIRRNLLIVVLVLLLVGYGAYDYFYYYFNPDLESVMYNFYDWRVIEERMNDVFDDKEMIELYGWEQYKGIEDYDMSDKFNLYVTEVVFDDLSKAMPEFDSEYNYVESKASYDEYMEDMEEYDYYYFEKIDDVFYMGLYTFDEDYNDIIRSKRNEINSSETLLIDLRSNPGGYTYVGFDFVDMFLEEGIDIVADFYHDYDGDVEKIITTTDEKVILTPKKIVVLTDQDTASTAEIVAYTLGEHLDNVVIIGQTTYGKGITTYTFEDYYGANVTVVGTTFSVIDKEGNEVSYHLKGIDPDIYYEWKDEDYSEDTKQLIDVVESIIN